MDLSGLWRVALLDAALTRAGADPDLDDGDWHQLAVPGHWAQDPTFADTTGPLLYRRRFDDDELTPLRDGERRWLVLEGVTAQSDVWLDGHYVGTTTAYFATHRFDVTEILADAAAHAPDHVLCVEVSAPDQQAGRSKRSLTGSLQTGPLAPAPCPGGIWRPVRLATTGPVAIRHARTVCRSADEALAVLRHRVVLDAAADGEVQLHVSVTGPDGEVAGGGTTRHEVATGENRLEWDTDVADPERWWPASLGDQPLYEVSLAVQLSGEGDASASDRRSWRLGLRDVKVSPSGWEVNGRRLFVKGVALGPQHAFLAEVSDDDVRADLGAVAGAGLDLVRVHGHVAPPALYAEADRLGLLVWQDLPLVGGYATSTRGVARAIAREVVDLLGHHPSIAVWCAHDEPNDGAIPEPPDGPDDLPTITRSLGRHLLPSWNRSVLDPLIRRELRAADPSRSVITRSGSLPMLTDLGGSDAHLWLGWHAGYHTDLGDVIRQWPRLGGFLGGFGSQSVPVRDWGPDEPTWHGAETGAFERYLPRRAYADGESWALATRAYQADLIRSHIETIRRLKYRPATGFCLMALADADPEGGFGVLDHERRRKPAFDALVDACRPVIVVADTPPDITTTGSVLELDVHVVSDLPRELGPTKVTARATTDAWSWDQSWEGDLGADSCAFVGTFTVEVPEGHGTLTIDLELVAGDRVATNRYQTVIIPPAETLSPTSTP